MPGIGDGRRSSILAPAGNSLSRAVRGSAAGCSAAARAHGCTAQRIKAKTARYRDIKWLRLVILTSHGKGGSLNSSRAYWSRFLEACVKIKSVPLVARVNLRQAPESAARMMLGMQILQAFACHMRIYLRRGQIAVAE